MDDQRPRFHLGPHGRDRRYPALVGERLVALVRDDPDAALDRQGRHRRQVGPPVEGPGGVVGRVEDQRPGPRRDGSTEGGDVELEAARLVGRHDDRPPVEQPHLLGVAHPVGGGHEHLVARIEQHGADVVEGVLGADRDDDLRRLVVQVVVALELGADRGPQLGDTGGVRVLGPALGERPDRRRLHPLGGIEVGLAGAEGEDVDALGPHRPGPGSDGERRGRLKAPRTFGQHGSESLPRRAAPQPRRKRSVSRFSTPGGTRPATLPP